MSSKNADGHVVSNLLQLFTVRWVCVTVLQRIEGHALIRDLETRDSYWVPNAELREPAAIAPMARANNRGSSLPLKPKREIPRGRIPLR